MLLALVAADQFRFLAFTRHWINEDQTLLWYAARDLGAGRIPQPSFYGQAYLTTWEAAPAELARWLGVPLWTGVPMATAALVVGPCVVLALAAWSRGRRVAALAALALPLLVRDEFLVSAESPGGRAAGIACALVGIAVLIRRPSTAIAVVGFVLVALGAAFNPTTIVAGAPAVAWFLVREGSVRLVAVAAVSAVPAAAWYTWAQIVVAQRPDYDIHRGASFAPDPGVLRQTLPHLDRYFDLAAPELWRSSSAALLATAVVVVVALASRRVAVVVAAAAMVAALLVTLAAPKALDGTPSAWLSFGRYVHLLPAALWFVAVVATEDRARRAAPAAAVTVVAIAVASFAARQVTFDERFATIVDVGRATAGAPVTPLRDTIDRCEDVRGAGSALVVFRYDRTGAYACGAIDYHDQQTLFPAYERRTWLLRDEANRTRSTFAFTEADDDACRRVEAVSGATCERDGTIAVVQGGRIDVIDVWRGAGEEVRSFEGSGR